MRKILFNDKYGLTAAVLNGTKTMTRRIIKAPRRTIEGKEVCGFAVHKTHEGVPYEVWLTGPDDESLCQLFPTYQIGEIVAVAQKYIDLCNCSAFYEALAKSDPTFPLECIKYEKGCYNKMFVKAEWMPHHIRMTSRKIERLHDISNEDCMKEGIIRRDDFINSRMEDLVVYTFENSFVNHVYKTYPTPRDAFACLIDRTSGKGTWERNAWVIAYSFELID